MNLEIYGWVGLGIILYGVALWFSAFSFRQTAKRRGYIKK